ncbi:ABC transporter substrate-binding protein [Methylobacterium gnaphalii]|uniref:ABC transporter substrate-binding protein n=1 Tax=Methylobacterium gnaphalii TaxID=1010610 RepID=A0A512JQ26_9HYPH|nr:ABC transporter substrate-binding protein [Methylobacterium gnaphalii]
MSVELPPIPIGSMIPLTGPSAADGAEFRNGMILAVEELNAQGGLLGRRFRPIFADTCRQTAEEVVAAARMLIEKHQVHAIVCGYNIGPQNSEYEPIADAGIIYVHANTLLQHHDTVMSDPERYFGCFMADPADYWYGPGFIKFLSWLRDTGQWTPSSDRLAIIAGSKPYSIVIAQSMAAAAADYGWRLCFGPRIVQTPTTQWREVIEEVRATNPAVVANTHFYAADLAYFQRQFMENPIDCLVYLQYGAMHRTFADIAQESSVGIIVSSVIGLLRDEVGKSFEARYNARFGEGASATIGCQSYSNMHHYAVAAAMAGGSGPPGDFEQNRKVAKALKGMIYRSVHGTIRYHPDWQAAVPYPVVTHDPSLGMPHIFYQIHDHRKPLSMIAPEPYNTERFILPPWMSRRRGPQKPAPASSPKTGRPTSSA